jgi:hypothetical protein
MEVAEQQEAYPQEEAHPHKQDPTFQEGRGKEETAHLVFPAFSPLHE